MKYRFVESTIIIIDQNVYILLYNGYNVKIIVIHIDVLIH